MVLFDGIEEIFQEIRDFNDCAKALVTLFTAIGTLTVLFFTICFLYELIQGFRLYVLSQICCRTDFVKKYGRWAVISGSTDGIGLSFAKELARRGHSILVIGRNDEKLERTKQMLEEEENVGEVETVKIDLSDSSLENFDAIRDKIDPENRDIGILINNAGLFNDKFQRFNRNDMKFIKNLVDVNILAVLHLTRMIMPGMLARERGLVVNVSSILANITSPYSNSYGATKTYLNAFTSALQMEYSAHPIDIINLTPGPVFTKLFRSTNSVSTSNFFIPTSDDYARTATNALSTGISKICGNWSHAVMDKSGIWSEKLGLSPIVFKIALSAFPKATNLSPVMKRKKPSNTHELDNQEVFNSTIET